MTIICPNCGSNNVSTTIETEQINIIDYWQHDGSGGRPYETTPVTADIPVRNCQDCEFSYRDSEAEDIIDKAAWAELERLGVKRKVNNDQLVSGQTYRVIMSDCCVSGEFVSKFIKYWDIDNTTGDEIKDEDELREFGTAIFENGVYLDRPSGTGGWYAERL